MKTNKTNWSPHGSTLLSLALVGILLPKLAIARADTLIGTFTVNYRYNAAGQAVNQSNPDYTKANPCFGNTIPPGPIFVPNTTTPGQYRLVTVSGAGCGVWSGDCSGGTFSVTGHGPGEEVTINHTFGQIVLYYWDWIAGDNDPSVQTTISVYKVSGEPKISVSPTLLSFSDKKVVPLDPTQGTYSKDIAIGNTGTADLEVSGITLSGANTSEFEIDTTGPFTVAPGQTPVFVTVTFKPNNWGTAFPVTERKRATLSISHNAPSGNPLIVPLEGGQRFDEVVNRGRITWMGDNGPFVFAPFSSVTTAKLSAEFTPDLEYTLGEAAALGGFDHFNWWQLVAQSPGIDGCRSTVPITLVGPLECSDCDLYRDISGTLPRLPFLDPPLGGYFYERCLYGFDDDWKPWYYSEDTALSGQIELERHVLGGNRRTGHTLGFFDQAVPARFKTSLAFVSSSGLGTLLWPTYAWEWATPGLPGQPHKTLVPSDVGPATLTFLGFQDVSDLTLDEMQAARNSGLALPGDCDRDIWPPTITVAMDTIELWPPDHTMKQVTRRISAIDSCDSEPQLSVEVACNEPATVKGDGNWLVVRNDDGSYDVFLRAERGGTGNGRIYTITVTAIDTSGNTRSEIKTVTVPHDERNRKL